MTHCFEQVKHGFNMVRFKRNAENIYKFESRFCYKDFQESAKLCRDELKKTGIQDVQLISLPSDGRTIYGDFIMPKAFCAEDALLEIIEPIDVAPKRIADLKETPFCIANRCASTGLCGITAEVIPVEQLQKEKNIKGKMVFVLDCRPEVYKNEVIIKHGAGIISSFSGELDMVNQTRWINGFTGGPGWYDTADDKNLLCFSIFPQRGRYLKELLQKGRVKVFAKTKTN